MLLELAAVGVPAVFVLAEAVGLILDLLLAADERFGVPLDFLFAGIEPGLEFLPLAPEGRALATNFFGEAEQLLFLLGEAVLLDAVLLAELEAELGKSLGDFGWRQASLDLSPELLRHEPHFERLAVGGGNLVAELFEGSLLVIMGGFARGQAGAALLQVHFCLLALES